MRASTATLCRESSGAEAARGRCGRKCDGGACAKLRPSPVSSTSQTGHDKVRRRPAPWWRRSTLRSNLRVRASCLDRSRKSTVRENSCFFKPGALAEGTVSGCAGPPVRRSTRQATQTPCAGSKAQHDALPPGGTATRNAAPFACPCATNVSTTPQGNLEQNSIGGASASATSRFGPGLEETTTCVGPPAPSQTTSRALGPPRSSASASESDADRCRKPSLPFFAEGQSTCGGDQGASTPASPKGRKTSTESLRACEMRSGVWPGLATTVAPAPAPGFAALISKARSVALSTRAQAWSWAKTRPEASSRPTRQTTSSRADPSWRMQRWGRPATSWRSSLSASSQATSTRCGGRSTLASGDSQISTVAPGARSSQASLVELRQRRGSSVEFVTAKGPTLAFGAAAAHWSNESAAVHLCTIRAREPTKASVTRSSRTSLDRTATLTRSKSVPAAL
mmetsp:Transcript_3730/g.13081  ORF Transcript_3730/g.13081 Transcript_3730/m.13081 type:complete len:453 (+) Transcript_3730:3070-4428(+)